MPNPSSVSSGNISPAIVGPNRDTKEVYVIGWVVLGLAIVIGAFWYFSGQGLSYATKAPTETLTSAQVTSVLKASAIPPVEPIVHSQTVHASSRKSNSIHTDIYFEVGRKGLTDSAKSILATQADLAKHDPDLGILVQGHTDQQGSADYNKKLGMKRAETVKTELMRAGVAEHQIKVVSLGKEGVLCIDNSDVCRNMNRRVHLELRKIGQEHMVLPIIATEPETTEPIQSVDGSHGNADGHDSLADNQASSFADPSATDPTPLTGELASGS